MQQVVSSNVLQTVEQVEEFVEYALHQDAVGFDIETWGDNRGVPHLNDLAWISLSTKERDAVVSFQHPVGTKVVGETRVPRKFGNGTRMYREPVYEKPPLQPDRAEVLRVLEPLLFSETILKAAHGGQFDIASLAKYYGDRIIPAPVTCTITVNWLVNENRKRFGMKYVTKDEYGFAYDDENVGKCVEKYPYNTVAHYAHCDSTYCYCELMRLLPEIDRQGLRRVYDLENDILRILSRIRLTGIRVDEPRLHQMKLDLEPKISDLETGIYVAAGKRFNLNSTPQKRDVLFGPKSEGGQGLKPWRLTKTAKQKKKAAEQQGREYTPEFTDWSTDGEALETFRGNPVIDALLDYQDVYKIYTTYVLGYIGDETHDCRIYEGRVYTDFVQYGTKTGRFSSRDPNLQNIPRPDTELGKLVRGAFIADEGHKLVVADYGQIELVVLAHYLGRGKLYEGFWEGIDPHVMTAAMVLGKRPEDITKDERQKFGKSINFAVVYGAGISKVASMIGCGNQEAKAVLNKHRAEFPEIYEYKDFVLSECQGPAYPHYFRAQAPGTGDQLV
jgi:DNA polymerase I-like protein with 3'-5' exonuclease and polymerase domains